MGLLHVLLHVFICIAFSVAWDEFENFGQKIERLAVDKTYL